MKPFTVKGLKKLFGLTKTKIRLAREAGTYQVKPKPLPLVEVLSGVRINSVDDAEARLHELKSRIDYDSSSSVSSTVLELMDIIEGVKYQFEPHELCVLLGDEEFRRIDKKASEGEKINLLLMSEKIFGGVNIYVGYQSPEVALHLGRVPTTLSSFMAYALNSDTLSSAMRLRNVRIILGHQTLILNSIFHAIKHYGAEVIG